MNTMKWLKLNLLVVSLLLVVPWVIVGGLFLRNALWKYYDPPITGILNTPSGSRFWIQNPNRAYEGLCPANVSSYGYQVFGYGSKASSKHQGNVTISRMYVEEPSSFRIVKDGVIGRSSSGYYIVDTSQRSVNLFTDRHSWEGKLAQMEVSPDIECYPCPLRRSYIHRGWLSYTAE